jgi:superfamily II DNA/RNA helicase
LDLFYIEMEQMDEEQLLEEKQYYIRKVLSDRREQRIIIFCKQKRHIEVLTEMIAH